MSLLPPIIIISLIIIIIIIIIPFLRRVHGLQEALLVGVHGLHQVLPAVSADCCHRRARPWHPQPQPHPSCWPRSVRSS